jgi:dipeptidyl aminopeptidase/acylaminoacyl peptidase
MTDVAIGRRDAGTESAPALHWESRFRASAILLSAIAPNDPARGMISTNRSGALQLYAWHTDTGELKQLTHEPHGRVVGELSPDGRWICYLRDEGGNELGHFVALPTDGGPEVDLTPGLAAYAGELLAFSRLGGRIAVVTVSDDTFVVRSARFEAGRAEDLRAVHSSRAPVMAISLSADASFVALSSSHRSNGLEFSLVTVDAETGDPGPELWDGPGTSVVVFACAPLAGDERVLATTNRAGQERALVWDRSSGARRDVPDSAPVGDLLPLDWSPDGGRVLLCRIDRGVQSLWIWDLEADHVRALDHPTGAFLGFRRQGSSYFHPGRDEVVARWEDFAHPRRLMGLDPSTGHVTRTIVDAGAVPPGADFTSVEIPLGDGETVQAWVARPAGPGPYPVILSTHGGPTSATVPNFDPQPQAYLDAGFAVLQLNYHGSTTFGREFEQSIWGRLGELELRDMAAARSWLIDEGIARPDQIFLTGWSYGGYLTLLGLGRQPDLWAGGMAGVAVADWQMNYEDSTDLLRGYQRMLFNGPPEEPAIAEAFRKGSPITYVDDVRVPVLIIQGRNDTRTPARPVERYVERLQARGHPVEIDWFDAGHTGGDDELAIEQTRRIVDFARGILAATPGKETP